ncbi:uncharacterized protein LOC143450813 isoform X1 [Clavelina lepadiformis]|uniref:uncharacterized protein LOC143450813 isoform X1 n=1 Tax=Clavelina lepadiformis TaxID=159417 RepID=UPI00404133A2
MTIEANSALKKHLLINSFDEDLSWDVRGRDASLFDLPYGELIKRSFEIRQSNVVINKLMINLLDRVQGLNESTRSFVNALKKLGNMTYRGENQDTIKNEILYLALLRGLKSHKSSEALSANLTIGRNFFAGSRQAIAFDDCINLLSRDVLMFNAHPRLEQSSQKEVITLVENEIAGAQRRIRNFNKSARCQVTSQGDAQFTAKRRKDSLPQNMICTIQKCTAPADRW